MADMDDASRIEAKVEAITHYLTQEFENFAIAYRADGSLTHTFTVTNGKKLFKLVIGWPTLADRNLTPERIDFLLKENVAEEMRLHGEKGHYWAPAK
jgi:hypothetical protein